MTLLEYIRQLINEENIPESIIGSSIAGQVIINRDELFNHDISFFNEKALRYVIELFTQVDARYRYTTPCRIPDEAAEIMFCDTLILDEAQTRLMNTLEIIEDPEVKGYESIPKYPYYRLRGKPVTPEQALDIIRRTDSIFSYAAGEAMGPDYIGNLNFINFWLQTKNDTSTPYGWVHPDGTIGLNTNTTKYPDWAEFLYEILGLKMAFPYLDFVIAITDWNCSPNYVWEQSSSGVDLHEKVDSDYPDFLEHVDYGIWVHDNKIEFMEPRRAKQIHNRLL